MSIYAKRVKIKHGLLDDSREILVFQSVDLGGYGVGIVTGFDGALGLEDDVAIVEEFVDVMDGDAALLVSAADDVLVDAIAIHSLAAMERDEGRMDVHDGTGIGIDEILGHKDQITSEHDEVDMILPEQGHDGFLVGHFLAGDELGGDSQPLGTLENVGIGLVADDEGNLSHLALLEIIGDILGIRA